MLNYGTGNPRYIHSGSSLDFTPTTHCIMTKKEPKSEDITRPSQITTANKYFEIGSHLEYTHRIYNLTKLQIEDLEAVIGETIQFFPHSDAGVSFDALVLNVQPKMEKNLAFLYYVDITVLTVNYFKFGTNLTLLTPNGSEVLQRNQVYNITWSSYGITGNVALELWKNGSKLSDIDTSEANDGTYAWTVPADATIGTDYQIKILNSTGYIYDLSDANFTIDYDGYYLAENNSDGNVAIKNTLTSLPDEYTFAFWYNGNGVARAAVDEIIKGIGGTGFLVKTDTTTLDYLAISNNGDKVRCSSWQMPTVAGWHSCIISVKHSTQSVAMYLDGAAGSTFIGTVNTTPPAFTSLQIFSTTTDARSYKLMGFWQGSFSASDVAAFHAGNISAISKTKIAFWKMNEDDSTPYTDKTLDDSGNGNHGTPVNINGATFFNQS